MLSKGAPLDQGERRQIKAAVRALDVLPTSAPASGIFDAIRLLVPVQAGLLSFIRPGAPEALVSHAVRLAPYVHESWLRTPPKMLAETLAPLILSRAGSLLRDSETIRGEQRERLEVLALLEAAGLGEGAGYKAMERPNPWYGAEHVMLALLTERKNPLPARSEVMLAALNPAIRRAILRLGLPLLSRQPLRAQIVAEQSLGYMWVSPTGSLVETNLRAHHLVDRYAEAAHVVGRRGAAAAFAARAMEQTRKLQPWLLADDESSSILQVDVHRLAKDTHLLSEDVTLVEMREVPPPPLSAKATRARALLTKTQLEVALLFASTGDSDEELAKRLSMSEATVRKHMQGIRERLNVSSRGAIVARIMR